MSMIYPVIYGNWIQKNYVAFKLSDGDNDGIISSLDVCDLVKNLLEKCPMTGFGKNQTKHCSCALFEEVKKMNEIILHENLYKDKKKGKKVLDFPTFLQSKIGLSCLVIELQQVLLKDYKIEHEKELKEQERQELRKKKLMQAILNSQGSVRSTPPKEYKRGKGKQGSDDPDNDGNFD